MLLKVAFGKGQTIKSHHNVGGLPDYVDFEEIIEPLRDLFKDEVRKTGLELGIPDDLVYRQPFPGPGLAIRIIGEITDEKLDILKEADFIFRDEIAKAGLDKSLNQYFAVLTNLKSVGVMGDRKNLWLYSSITSCWNKWFYDCFLGKNSIWYIRNSIYKNCKWNQKYK